MPLHYCAVCLSFSSLHRPSVMINICQSRSSSKGEKGCFVSCKSESLLVLTVTDYHQNTARRPRPGTLYGSGLARETKTRQGRTACRLTVIRVKSLPKQCLKLPPTSPSAASVYDTFKYLTFSSRLQCKLKCRGPRSLGRRHQPWQDTQFTLTE